MADRTSSAGSRPSTPLGRLVALWSIGTSAHNSRSGGRRTTLRGTEAREECPADRQYCPNVHSSAGPCPGVRLGRRPVRQSALLSLETIQGRLGGGPLPPPRAGRLADVPLEGTRERGLGLVADRRGGPGDRVAVLEEARGELETPAGEVLHRRHADVRREPLRERRARHADRASQ